jgi:7-cyano-7-deazaguanine synthase in queuosine biosynthesis
MIVECLGEAADRHDDGLAALFVSVPQLQLRCALDLPFKRLYERCGTVDPISLDLLMVASLCYVIDKMVPRKSAWDNWTRQLEVEFPVSAPDVWATVREDLEEALSFLSGDMWQLSFRRIKSPYFRLPTLTQRQRRRRVSTPIVTPVTAVCLFSGGLDSLSGAIDLLAKNDHSRVCLVGHYDTAGPRSQQQQLFAEIRKPYLRRVDLVQTRVSHKPDAAQEMTLRSRSFVFIALGLYIAKAMGVEVPLYAPENGLIAINVPLTPSRAGSCSTRTMHPFFLTKLRAVADKLGFRNPIINPFQLKTKGEVLQEGLNPPLLKSLVDLSVSCSHATRRQHWVRKRKHDANNCGYCVPCLFRRAALHHVSLDDGKRYGIDVGAGELPLNDTHDSADDLRAVLDFLSRRKEGHEIALEICSVAPMEGLSEYVNLVQRGFEEVRALIHDKARPSLCRAAGIERVKK